MRPVRHGCQLQHSGATPIYAPFETERGPVVSLVSTHEVNAIFDGDRLANDWNGADFLAHHMVTGETLKIQLKGRVSIAKKYIGKDLWIVCPLEDRWLAIPHDMCCPT